MYRRWLLIGAVISFMLLAVLVLISIGLAKRQSGTPASPPTITVASDWARSMLQKYPYEPGSYSGVLPTSSLVMVWVVSRRTISSEIPATNHFTIEDNRFSLTGRLSDSVFYTVQDGDDFAAVDTAQRIDPSDILFGDFVAARTTYLNNLPLILEVRKLNRASENQ